MAFTNYFVTSLGEIRPADDEDKSRPVCPLDALGPYLDFKLIETPFMQKSWFIVDTNMMYHLVHIGDSIVSSNYEYNRYQRNWHPYISRIYFGVLAMIQTARCMEFSRGLNYKDRSFLNEFLHRFPPNSLSIPGFMIPYFQSICCSIVQGTTYGHVYPRLPKTDNYHPRDQKTGAPKPNSFSYKIPNIPQLIGFANRLTSLGDKFERCEERYMEFKPTEPFKSQKFSEDTAIINGYDWAQRSAGSDVIDSENVGKAGGNSIDGDDLKWYFCTPGLVHEPECGDKMTRNFAMYGSRIQLPKFDAQSSFDSLAKYLGMDESMRWFEVISSVMYRYAKWFRGSGDLSQCLLEGPAAGQVEIHYRCSEEELTAPKYPGDYRFHQDFEFSARTINMNLTDFEAALGFYSQINTVYHTDHPYLSSSGPLPNNFARGPYWASSKAIKDSVTIRRYHCLHGHIIQRFSIFDPEGTSEL